METIVRTLVAVAQAQGLALGELTNAVSKEWLAQRKAARPERTPAEKATIKRKTAATRARNKATNEKITNRWNAQCKLVATNTDRVRLAVGPFVWKTYENEVADLAFNGNKDYNRAGVLKAVLGPKGVKELTNIGLDLDQIIL